MAPLEPHKDENSSILRDEERAFPRGGASALTPLEYKQIQIQATRDVLFEEKRTENTHLGRNDSTKNNKRRKIAEIGHTQNRHQKKRKYDVPAYGKPSIPSLNYKVSSFQEITLVKETKFWLKVSYT